ncbi:MAG: aspartate kinase [Alistipes sp.]|nr:aspartate kinase [Alistipes sp.]
MKVYKFGGASVKNADGVRNLKHIIEDQSELFIIVSAMGKTTNALESVFDAYRTGDAEAAINHINEIAAYHQNIIDELFGEHRVLGQVEALLSELHRFITTVPYDASRAEERYDRTVAFGELISTTIISEWLKHEGIANHWVDMRRCFVTQFRHKDANVFIEESTPLLRREVAGSLERVFVGQGFIGSAADGSTTTLGREGSDYSAAVVAHILDAQSMTVWKDVDGILNADPKIFPDAHKIDTLNYVDTIELAYSGAQIIHPKTIKPLQNKNIPLYVKPFGNKAADGTRIDGTADDVKIPIIILKRNQSLLTLRSRDLSFVLEEKFPIVFSILERFRIKTNLIHNSAVALNLCTEQSWRLEEAAAALQAEGFDTTINEEVELLTIRNHTDEALKAYTFSERNIVKQIDIQTVRVVLRKE